MLIYAQKHLKVKLKLVGFNNYFLTLGIYNYAANHTRQAGGK